jgi:hypothetical protein
MIKTPMVQAYLITQSPNSVLSESLKILKLFKIYVKCIQILRVVKAIIIGFISSYKSRLKPIKYYVIKFVSDL